MATALPTTDQPLQIGARSTWIAQLQQLLQSRGFPPGAIDGTYGVNTDAALRGAVWTLSYSRADNARQIVSGAPATWATAGAAIYALQQAFQQDDLVTGDGSAGSGVASYGAPGSAPDPIADTETIVMGPQQAAKMEQQLGLTAAPPTSTWTKVAYAGAGAALLGAIVWGIVAIAKGNGRRRARA